MQCNVNRVAGQILLSDCHRSWLLLDFQPFAAYRVGLVKLPSRQFYIQRLPTVLISEGFASLLRFFNSKVQRALGPFISEAVITLSKLGGWLFTELQA